MSDTNVKNIKGGEFLIKDQQASEVFIPDEWSEEQQMMADSTKEFIKTEILPNLERIDS